MRKNCISVELFEVLEIARNGFIKTIDEQVIPLLIMANSAKYYYYVI